jgi:tetratricopeptide (TPR) repeat protein
MAWFGSGGENVPELIAKGKYQKAIEVLEQQLDAEARNPRLRLQLADVLVLAGRPKEAVPVLIDVADMFASNGEAPKAIAALKKIERLAPGRRDVEAKLASLIRDKKGKPAPAGPTFHEPAGSTFDASHFEKQAEPVVTDEMRIAAAKAASWIPSTREEQKAPEPIPIIEITSDPEPKDAAAQMSEAAFQAQMMDAIQHALKKPARPAPAAAPAPAGALGSPLFSSFSQDELIAVMHGLRLLSFEPGDIIITEGDAGDSLFVIASGIAKAFVRRDGAQKLARSMGEGTFFGEISILSGKPRTATVTAATQCELLELDKATLDGITSKHPNVRQVLEDFYVQRATGQPD